MKKFGSKTNKEEGLKKKKIKTIKLKIEIKLK